MKHTAHSVRRIGRGHLEKHGVFALRPVVCCVMLAFGHTAAGNPTGAQVVNGAVSFARPDAKTLNVTNSPGSIIHWQGFSIGAGEATRFIQQSSSSAVLNRVVGADISQIHGQLLSNGRVFLVNPAGIVIGAGASIDTAGFVGSTLRMQDADFLAGKLRFQGDGSSGSIVNEGWIKAGAGGNVVLVAPNIQNSGIIQTEGGQIVLAAGQKMTIGSLDLEGVQFEIQAPADSVVNLGKLLAEGGAVGVFAGTLKHSGDIRASALTRDEGGRVVLKARGDVTLTAGSTTSANGRSGGSVLVQSETGTTLVSGNVEAKGSAGKGGDVRLLGDRVGIFDAAGVDVSGARGGGQILVGGDFQGRNADVQNASRTVVGPGAMLRADATEAGDGGKVIVWADYFTRFDGKISARGGALSGNGGFAETSGKEFLNVGDAYVDLGAPAGLGGTWLLDPRNITVQAGGGGTAASAATFAATPAADVTVSPATLNAAPGSIVLQANNDITFASDFVVQTSKSLTAQAGRSIFVNANISGNDSSGITLIANETAAAGVVAAQRASDQPASIIMAPGTSIVQGPGGGDIVLRINAGLGDPTKTSGNIVVAALETQNGSISIVHNGPTAGGSILRASSGFSSLKTDAGAGHGVNLQITNATAPVSAAGSIGTVANPINIETPIVEAYSTNSTGGIFLTSTQNAALQIGGSTVNAPVARGVQTLSGGPIQVSTAGTLTQAAGAGVCGTGGPVCAGPSATAVGSLGATETVTLRAADMDLTRTVRGREVTLLPVAGNPIILNSVAGVGAGTLRLSAAELNTAVDTDFLHVGEDASGGVSFAVGNLTITNNKNFEIRTGGSIVGDATALGGNDLTFTRQLRLRANAIGITGDEFGITPDFANSTMNVTSTGGSVFIRHADAANPMLLSKYTFSFPGAGAPPTLRLTHSGPGTALPTLDTSLNVPNVNVVLAGFATTTNNMVTGSNITVTANSLLLSGNAFFQSPAGTTATFATPVTVSGNTTFTSGTHNFNQGATLAPGVLLNGGAANFNAVSTVQAGGGTIFTLAGGTLGGSSLLTVNGDALWSGGGMSGTGGAAETAVTGTLTMNGADKSFANRILTVDGAVTWTAGNVLADGGTFTNNAAFNIHGDLLWTTNGAPGAFTTINNAGGITRSMTNGTAALDRAIVTGAGAIDVLQGLLRLSGDSSVPAAQVANLTGAITVAATSTLQFAGGTYQTGNSITGPGNLAVSGGTLNANGVVTTTGSFTASGNSITNFAANATPFAPNGVTISGTATANFNRALNDAGTFHISGGMANFGVASTVVGPVTVSGGTVTGAGGVTVNGVTTVAAGNSQLGGTFDTDVFTMTGGALGILPAGLLIVSGNSPSTVTGGTLTNAGEVRVTGGDSLTFSGTAGLINSGTLNAQAGTIVYSGGTQTFNGGTTFTGAVGGNRVTANSAFGGAINSTNLILEGGAFSGTASFGGTTAWTGGQVTGAFTIPAGSTLDLTGAGAKVVTSAGSITSAGALSVSGGTLSNNGTLTFNGGAAPLTIGAGSTVTNNGTLNLNATVTNTGVSGAGTLQNAGTLNSTGGGVTTLIATPFNNTNTVNVDGGILMLTGNGADTGSYAIDPNTTLEIGGGTRNVNAGAAFTGAGALVVSGGTLNVNTPMAIANPFTLTGVGTTLAGTGDLAFTGPLAWSQGAGIGGTGGLTTSGVTTFSNSGNTLAKNWTNGAGGIVNMNPGSTLQFAGHGSTFSNLGEFNLATTGATPIGLAPGASVTIINQGVFNKAGAGTQSILGIPFTNAAGGSLNVSGGGTLAVPGMNANAGVLTVSNAVFTTNGVNGIHNTGTIRGNGTVDVGAGQTVTNDHIVSPGASPGTLVIVGNYTQGPLGTLVTELGGTVQGVSYDLLQVTGAANLAGTLAVSFVNGFVPSGGFTFGVMKYSSVTGNFTSFSSPVGSLLQAVATPTVYNLTFPFQMQNEALNEATRLNDRFIDDAPERNDTRPIVSALLCE